jgi:uncharacterized protein YndB with AHSA1/START domain
VEKTQHQEAAQLRISRNYRVAPEKVWRAWTEPQALSQWFGSGKPGSVTAAEIDLRVGGRYRIAFDMPDGQSHEVSGVYQEVVDQRRLVFTWAWKSTPERVSRVSIDLSPVADGTDLRFVHDRFFDEAARKNHEGGWMPVFDHLGIYLHAGLAQA